ncbi:GDSL esterase/lipase At5g45960-like [Silene latifolia]|uniref:GDSL esterase/lipase At5g45960-like n=1 Tax=Silene latifolia TaxID=37657 RepID=UPI003D789DC9
MTFLLYKCWPSIFLLPFLVMSTTYTSSANNNLRNTQKIVSNSSNNTLAVFVFGDSTVDPGNNNHIETYFRSDHSPYGIDYPNHIPTGRFSNGMLATDLIASYAGIKQSIPAYLDPSLSLGDLITGVSFASSGAGYDPLTAAKSNVMDMSKQLELLDEYKIKIKSMIGKRRMKDLLKRSIFVISCGTNDIMYTLGIVDSILQPYTAPTYLHFMLDKSKSFIQGLRDRGAEKIVVVGLPPVGCLPAVMTSHATPFKQRQCVESLSSIATDFNNMLVNELNTMQPSQPTSSMLLYADIYTPLLHQINYPTKYGFEEVDKGCCGTGFLEGSFACNSMTNICNDRSKYIFWDSIHPTERSYSLLLDAIRPIVDKVLGKL